MTDNVVRPNEAPAMNFVGLKAQIHPDTDQEMATISRVVKVMTES